MHPKIVGPWRYRPDLVLRRRRPFRDNYCTRRSYYDVFVMRSTTAH